MPGVIDSLFVTLGLNTKDFEAGQKSASESFDKTKKVAVESGKHVENAAQGMSSAIAGVTRRVLELYATFLGAKGLTSFIGDLITSDATLGRFSDSLGLSAQSVSGMEMAVERMGGRASDAAGTIQRLSKSLFDLRYNGKNLPNEFYQLEAATRVHIPTNQGVPAYLNATAEALQKLYAVNPSRALFSSQAMGIDQSTFYSMVAYGSQYTAKTNAIGSQLAPTKEAILAAQELQSQWIAVTQQAQSFANVAFRTLAPSIELVFQKMSDWIDKNRSWIQTGIVNEVKRFGDYLTNVNWKAVGSGLSAFGDDLMVIGRALQYVIDHSTTFLAIWGGVKATQIISGLAVASGASATGLTFGTALGVGTAVAGGAWLGSQALSNGVANDTGDNSQRTIAQEIYNYARAQGMSRQDALDVVGNAQGEGGLVRPSAMQRGDGGTAGGQFQWHKPRRDAILKETGIDVWDPKSTTQQQMQAFFWEMKHGSDPGARKAWDNINDPNREKSAEYYLVHFFERSANQFSDTLKRQVYGANWSPYVKDYQPIGGASSHAKLSFGALGGANHNTTVGTMIVNSASTDAAGISHDIKAHLTFGRQVSAANTGVF